MDKAINRLSEIADKYSMPIMMANCIGQSGGMECGGKTSVWNNKGLLVGQLDDTNEGIIVFDTDTHNLIKSNLSTIK